MFKVRRTAAVALFLVLVIVMATATEARRRRYPSGGRRKPLTSHKTLKQLEYEARETNTPNFVRLVLMRLVYGLATQMGIEDRLDTAFGERLCRPMRSRRPTTIWTSSATRVAMGITGCKVVVVQENGRTPQGSAARYEQ
ncbi:hypothetical protein pipiens_018390, partial [Culex pipiens pipiens]